MTNSASANPTLIAVGGASEVTIAFENRGLGAAQDMTLTAPLPAGLALDAFRTDGAPGDVGGNPVSAATLQSAPHNTIDCRSLNILAPAVYEAGVAVAACLTQAVIRQGSPNRRPPLPAGLAPRAPRPRLNRR